MKRRVLLVHLAAFAAVIMAAAELERRDAALRRASLGAPEDKARLEGGEGGTPRAGPATATREPASEEGPPGRPQGEGKDREQAPEDVPDLRDALADRRLAPVPGGDSWNAPGMDSAARPWRPVRRPGKAGGGRGAADEAAPAPGQTRPPLPDSERRPSRADGTKELSGQGRTNGSGGFAGLTPRKEARLPGPDVEDGMSGVMVREALRAGERGAKGASRPPAPGPASVRPGPRPPSWPERRQPAAPAPKPPAKARPEVPLPRFKPLLLSSMIGKGPLQPPKDAVVVPDLVYLSSRTPARLPDGAPLVPAPPDAAAVEAYAPPDPESLAGPGPCPKKAHWHGAKPVYHYHDGAAWGRWDRGEWTWQAKKDGRWWILPGGKLPVLLRHGERWWWKSKGVWFLLHEGEPWGYRHFGDLGLEGYIHPASGTRMVYSADGARVAMLSPGFGAVLFDAATGEVLGRWTEDELPRPRTPAAPSGLIFPP